MSEKNRVEIHDFKDWKAGVYLIEAGCGQGKNYFVFNTLFPYAHENGKRMLVFSNRVALREQQQAQTQEKDVKLITYQSLEHDEYLETMQDTKNKVRGLMQQVSEYDYIVLDEAHYLYQDGDTSLEKGSHIHHISGDSLDNRIENLEQLTPKEHKKQFESPYLIITKRQNRELSLKRGWECLQENYEAAYGRGDAAKILGMTESEVDKLVKGLDRSGTGNPNGCAPDGRFVIRFENVYPPLSVLDSWKKGKQ